MATLPSTSVERVDQYVTTLHFTKYQINQPSEVFFLPTFESQCSIKIVRNLISDGYNTRYSIFGMVVSLEFTQKPSYLSKTFLKLSVCFNSSKNKHFFTLHKLNDKNFESDNKTLYESTLTNETSRSGLDVEIKIYYDNELSNNNLVKDMHQLLLNTTYSDLQLVAEGQLFKVHKNILSVRSKVLCRMIEADMIEKKTSTIKLVQWDCAVVKQLLNYIYTDTCDMTVNPHKLFQLAHYLEITPLENNCKYYIGSHINTKNITNTLDLTNHDQYKLSNLRTAAEKFIESNGATLAEDPNYINYLSKSLSLKNIALILNFSKKYKIDSLMDKGVQFVLSNHKETLKIEECNDFFISNPSLMLKLLGHSLEAMETLHSSKKQSHE